MLPLRVQDLEKNHPNIRKILGPWESEDFPFYKLLYLAVCDQTWANRLHRLSEDSDVIRNRAQRKAVEKLYKALLDLPLSTDERECIEAIHVNFDYGDYTQTIKKKSGETVTFKANINNLRAKDRARKEREKRKYKEPMTTGRYHPSTQS